MEEELDDIINDIQESRLCLKIAKFISSLEIQHGERGFFACHEQLVNHLHHNWDKDEIVINKTRQSGVTSILEAFVIDRCVREKDKYVIVLVSNNLEQSRHMLDQIDEMCRMNNINHKRKKFDSIEINGNLITNTRNDIPRLNGRRLVVLYDEYAHIYSKGIRDMETKTKFYDNVLNIYVSSPNGLNSFYDKCNESDNVFVIKWSDVPNRDESWKAKQIKMLGGEHQFEQQYNNKFI